MQSRVTVVTQNLALSHLLFYGLQTITKTRSLCNTEDLLSWVNVMKTKTSWMRFAAMFALLF